MSSLAPLFEANTWPFKVCNVGQGWAQYVALAKNFVFHGQREVKLVTCLQFVPCAHKFP